MENDNFKLNEAESQFEYHVKNNFAFLEFYREGKKIFFTHTEAPEKLRGTGAAKKLVEKALQCSRENGLTVVPLCSYVAHFIDTNPGWQDILSEGYQM